MTGVSSVDLRHFHRPLEWPFTAAERDRTTILFGGLTCAHERLIEAVLADIRCFDGLHGLTDYGLADLLAAPQAWARKKPVTNVDDAARAIFRVPLRQELRRALAHTPRSEDLVTDLAIKLTDQAAEPSSIFYLSQPYLQAIARNYLKDCIRAARRDASSRTRHIPSDTVGVEDGSGTTRADQPIPTVDVLQESPLRHDLVRLLTPRELEIVHMLVDGLSEIEVVERLGLPLAELEQMRAEIKRKVQDYRGVSAGS